MSVHRSYFSKNNTIVSNSYANVGRNPVTDLIFGFSRNTVAFDGYSRFIFNLDLYQLIDKIQSGVISTGCTTELTHTLTMTNTIRFDEDLLNTYNSDERMRASSFDLVLFRIPLSSGTTGNTQMWDEGVGYDYSDTEMIVNTPTGYLLYDEPLIDNNYSTRPSNCYQTTTITNWSEPGIYSNTNTASTANYSGLTIVDTQHFDKGNEDINFNMTNEINGILDGTITGVTGWGIAYLPSFELITGLTSNYSVSFFNRHTQTFYEPYLLTTYDDLIQDNRNLFVEKVYNKLYLYSYIDGDFVNLDNNPNVDILDSNGDIVYSGLSTCLRTKGVYEVEIPPISGYKTPCQFNDIWKNIVYDGESLPDIENDFVIQSYKNRLSIGTQSKEPSIFGFDFYGIKQDEKILNTDLRKVGVEIKKAYSTNQLLQNIDAYYRVYVREGTTEVQVQDWTNINRSTNEYYFIFDTRDKIPNEYFIDIKVNISGEKDTYKRTIKFLIVNKK
jgi:hypothetical protein